MSTAKLLGAEKSILSSNCKKYLNPGSIYDVRGPEKGVNITLEIYKSIQLNDLYNLKSWTCKLFVIRKKMESSYFGNFNFKHDLWCLGSRNTVEITPTVWAILNNSNASLIIFRWLA